MKHAFLGICLLLVMACGSTAIAVEAETTAAERKWNELRGRLDKFIEAGVIGRMENRTGRPSSYDAALSVLKTSYKIDPEVVSYYLIKVDSDKQVEAGRAVDASVLVLETAGAKKLEKEFNKVDRKTIPLVCQKPGMGVILRDENCLIFLTFGGLGLNSSAKELIAALEK